MERGCKLSSVKNKLEVKMDGDELHKQYQKIYDETVNRNNVYEKLKEKQWNRGQKEIISLLLNSESLVNLVA